MMQESTEASNDLVTRTCGLLQSVVALESRLLEDMRRFLSMRELRECLAKQKEQHQQNADRFDLFHALWLERREIYHSRFIAYLLDPGAYHDQGLVFLNSFLSELKLNGVVDKIEAVRIYTERSIPSGGRIDICIDTSQVIIAIENKVDAVEGDKQILRYREWLDVQPQKTRKLVFLTPKGDPPRTGQADILMSYSQLSDCFETALVKISKGATLLRMIVEQYARLCRNINMGGQSMARIDEKMYALLTQEDNLELALEVHHHVELAKRNESEDFKKRVREFLKTKTTNDPHLKIVESGNFGVAIQIGENSNFLCGIGKFDLSGGKGSNGWHGWIAPESETARIKAEATRFNFKKDISSPMFESFRLFKNEPLLEVIRDKSDANHSLAKELAEGFWKFFCDTRPFIESLNSFNPPPTLKATDYIEEEYPGGGLSSIKRNLLGLGGFLKKKVIAKTLYSLTSHAKKLPKTSWLGVGIFWISKRSLISFMETISQVQEEAGFKSGSYDHCPVWPEAQKKCPSFIDLEYDEVPRGRVVYDVKADKFYVYCNEKVLKQYADKIRAEFGLPARKTKFIPDTHYTLKHR